MIPRSFCTRLLLLCAALVTQSIVSCVSQEARQLEAARAELQALQLRQASLTYLPGTYEYFVSHNKYPVTMLTFRNLELMARANKDSRVVICLSQQRGRLYVDGQVAADWPVSTGIRGRETPTGEFTITTKKEKYASNRYGKIYDAEGNCLNSDADSSRHKAPEGGVFVGAAMPYWMRLTDDGVGMHIGRVVAGRRLSHGCIRTPAEMARELFRITAVGTHVTITDELEAEYPAREALVVDTLKKQAAEDVQRAQQKVDQLTLLTQPRQAHTPRPEEQPIAEPTPQVVAPPAATPARRVATPRPAATPAPQLPKPAATPEAQPLATPAAQPAEEPAAAPPATQPAATPQYRQSTELPDIAPELLQPVVRPTTPPTPARTDAIMGL